ncbi:MAG: putative quinol monooxygenase [Gammaproteobacteria bacterium]|jgi:quinol monooxygenase YgiN
MQEEIVCVATFVAKEGKADQLKKDMSDLVDPTRKEEGNLRYELNQSLDNNHEFVMVEKYKSKEAFDLHGKQSHMQHFINVTLKEVVESASVKLYKQVL